MGFVDRKTGDRVGMEWTGWTVTIEKKIGVMFWVLDFGVPLERRSMLEFGGASVFSASRMAFRPLSLGTPALPRLGRF